MSSAVCCSLGAASAPANRVKRQVGAAGRRPAVAAVRWGASSSSGSGSSGSSSSRSSGCSGEAVGTSASATASTAASRDDDDDAAAAAAAAAAYTLSCPHFDQCSGCSMSTGLETPPTLARARAFFAHRGIPDFQVRARLRFILFYSF